MADETFQYIDITSVDRESKKIVSPQCLLGRDAPSRARKLVQTGDVLVSMTRPNLNAVALTPESLDGQVATTGFDVLRAIELDPRWLFYLVRTRSFVERMSELVQGALYPAVRPRDVRGYTVPVAPLNEQKRIADKLDAILARVDTCRERLDHVPTILKRFRQSVLAAATSGKLTEEWRNSANRYRRIKFEEDSISIPYSWGDLPLTDLIDPARPLCYGVVQPGENAEGGIPLIRVQDMERGDVLVRNLRTVSAAIDAAYRRSRVKKGDILVSVVGTIGRTAIVPADLEANIARAIARIACRTGVRSHWVNFWLSCDVLQRWLTRSAREVARKTLNLSELGTTRIALPPEEEQDEIVRRVESLFFYCDHIDARYTAARTQVARLTPAMLAKAFRGELVPQDPNDEPASVLLQRIRTSRSAKPTKSKQEKRARLANRADKAENFPRKVHALVKDSAERKRRSLNNETLTKLKRNVSAPKVARAKLTRNLKAFTDRLPRVDHRIGDRVKRKGLK